MDRMTKQEGRNTAQYRATRKEIGLLMEALQQELDGHAFRQARDPANGGLVGDMLKVRDDLLWTLAFISGREREDLESYLSESVIA